MLLINTLQKAMKNVLKNNLTKKMPPIYIFSMKSFSYLCNVIKRKDGLWKRFMILRMVN